MGETTLNKPSRDAIEGQDSNVKPAKVLHYLIWGFPNRWLGPESLEEVFCGDPLAPEKDAGVAVQTFSMIDVGGGPDVSDELLLMEERLGALDVVLFPSHVRSLTYPDAS